MAPRQHSRLSLRSRRKFLTQTSSGLGALALSSLLRESGLAAPGGRPSAAGEPHHKPTAKSVIWCFMNGGPSHLDTFDPKPALEKYAGQPMPESYGRPTTAFGTAHNTLMPSQREWAQHGESGLWISDWYPRVAEHADDLAVIRSCWMDGLNHAGAMSQMNTGSILAGRPSMGAWVTYGLGAANRNLPTFIVLNEEGPIRGDTLNWGAGFLPAAAQGTFLQQQGAPILNLETPPTVGVRQQRGKLDLLGALNRRHAEKHPRESELDARLESYELAWRMQTHAPEAIDLTGESAATRKLYGIGEEPTDRYGAILLQARRLVERGVRFVQAYCGRWDAHSKLEENHTKWCGVSDKTIAGLLTDLKSRGLLDETLVIWGGEFGRTPFNEKGDGRDHNPWGFTMWMAGGGVKGGQTIGETDEIGLRAVEKPYHVHDIHATILHLLGLNHLDLTYLRNGRSERPTVDGGKLITEALG